MAVHRPLLALLLAPVLITGCHANKDTRDLDKLDNELTAANGVDPALAGALNDQIMVDPTLAQQSNRAAVRPAPQPNAAPVPPADASATDGAADATLRHAPPPGKDCPHCTAAKGALTLGELARRQQAPRTGSCASNIQYSARWATRLGDLPVYPGAHVTEAAGADSNGCALRVVSFTTSAPVSRVIDWYYTQASKAGYSADQEADGVERVLGGTRARDDGAFVVFVNPKRNGSAVDLVVNNGR